LIPKTKVIEGEPIRTPRIRCGGVLREDHPDTVDVSKERTKQMTTLMQPLRDEHEELRSSIEKVRTVADSESPSGYVRALHIGWSSEVIAYAQLGEDIARMSWISFYLASQPIDVHLEHMTLPEVLRAPDVFEQ
jgi:hypothetical protein